MKKVILVLTISALAVTIAACTKTTGQADPKGNSGPLSTEAELLVGTFKLENTDLAVTAGQAKQLLPLWQTLQALSTSNTAATEEISAVVDQIKSTMTTKQMDKITAMKLTQQDIMSIMGQAGVANGPSTTTTPMALGGLPSSGGNAQGAGGGPGGGQAGGPPSGGGNFPAGGGGFQGGTDPGIAGGPGGASSTPQAIRTNGMSSQVPAPLLNALIQLLQKKVQP
jgi:hypothetical protein